MARNLTQDEINDIPRLKAQGYTTRGIAKLYKVHNTAVNYWIRRHTLAGNPIPPDQIGRPKKTPSIKEMKFTPLKTMTQDEADALYYTTHDCVTDDPDIQQAKIDGWIDGVGIEVIN